MSSAQTITWSDFEKIEMRVGTIVAAYAFPEARKPAYKLEIDLGELGVKHSSAQITQHYTPDTLIGKQVLCVCNFPEKQIGPFISQVLTCGFADEQQAIALAIPDKKVPNGAKLF